MKKKRKTLIGMTLAAMILFPVLHTVYGDNRNREGYYVDRHDQCNVIETSVNITDVIWEAMCRKYGDVRRTFSEYERYEISETVLRESDPAVTYGCAPNEYNFFYPDCLDIKFESPGGLDGLIGFINDGVYQNFSEELRISKDMNYLPIYSFVKCPADGKLARVKMNYYGYYCEYDQCYIITGTRHQTKCSGFGYELPDAFGASGWGTGWDFGYGGGTEFIHNHCYGHPVPYVIQYDANGGTGFVESGNCVYDSVYELEDGIGFHRDGWEMTGWQDNKGNIYQPGQAVKNLTAQKDEVIMMYALWNNITHPDIIIDDRKNSDVVFDWTNRDVNVEASVTDLTGLSCILIKNTDTDTEIIQKNYEVSESSADFISNPNTTHDIIHIPITVEGTKTYSITAVNVSGIERTQYFTVQIDKTDPAIRDIEGIYDTNGMMIQINTHIEDIMSGISTAVLYNSKNEELQRTGSEGKFAYDLPGGSYEDFYYVIAKDIAGNSHRQNIAAAYLTNHYIMNTDGENYTLKEGEKLLGIVNESITPAVKSFVGFTSPGPQTVYLEDTCGNTVSYYYFRNKYTVTINGNGGYYQKKERVDITQYFETELFLEVPVYSGNSFVGWEFSGEGSLNENMYTFGAGNGELSASWEKKITDKSKFGFTVIRIDNRINQNITGISSYGMNLIRTSVEKKNTDEGVLKWRFTKENISRYNEDFKGKGYQYIIHNFNLYYTDMKKERME